MLPNWIPGYASSNGSLSCSALTNFYTPVYVDKTITINAIAISVTTATSLASCNIQQFIIPVTVTSTLNWAPPIGSYSSYGITPTMIGEITNITTTGLKSITGLSITVTPGYYYFVTQTSSYTGTLALNRIYSNPMFPAGYMQVDSTGQWGVPYIMKGSISSYTSGTAGIPGSSFSCYSSFSLGGNSNGIWQIISQTS
jgi:uncharacterized membrane protein